VSDSVDEQVQEEGRVDPRYPIGPFVPDADLSSPRRLELLSQLAVAPGNLKSAVAGLTPAQLDTPYRLGGWTVRQVVHHLADAQLNWYIRTKLALTEDEPLVKPYDEVRWADLPDAQAGPIEPSLLLLDGLYQRWTALFHSLDPAQWHRRIIHPERGVFALDATLGMHVWHGLHHTAQINALKQRMGWQ
jgi:uncharacterized damage-inducible protein DinB